MEPVRIGEAFEAIEGLAINLRAFTAPLDAPFLNVSMEETVDSDDEN
jgi:hypothetical protein